MGRKEVNAKCLLINKKNKIFNKLIIFLYYYWFKLIMYTIKENLRPIADFYDRYINGFYLSGLLQFKQQNELGGDYISKVWRAEEH